MYYDKSMCDGILATMILCILPRFLNIFILLIYLIKISNSIIFLHKIKHNMALRTKNKNLKMLAEQGTSKTSDENNMPEWLKDFFQQQEAVRLKDNEIRDEQIKTLQEVVSSVGNQTI